MVREGFFEEMVFELGFLGGKFGKSMLVDGIVCVKVLRRVCVLCI